MRGLRTRGAAVLIAALVGGLVAPPTASTQSDDEGTSTAECDETLTPFDDIPAGHPAAADVSCMYSLGVVKGTSATHFSPAATLTRAQMSVMLARLWVALGNDCPAGATLPFTDVPAGHWAASEIACLYTLRVVNGTSATQFSPDATLTRAQIAVMAARLWRTHGKACPTGTASFSDVPAGHWAYADIGCLQALGIMGAVSGTAFKPDDNATRLQMVMALARLWRANSAATTPPPTTTSPPTTGGGGQQPDSGQTPVSQPLQAGAPDTPTGLSLRTADGALVANWMRPGHNGSAIRSYRLWYCTSAPSACGNPQTTYLSMTGLSYPSNPSKTITGLTNGTQYHVRVLATNDNGSSAYSGAVTGTPLGVPNAPRNLTVVGGKSGNTLIGSGKLQVTWQPPDTSNSQAAVTGYRVEHSTGGSSWTRWSGAVTGTTTTITGLTDGTAYRIRVQATSSVGGSDWAQSGAVTPSTKPSTPAAPTASPPSNNTTGRSLNVSWSAPDNGGAAITDYDVQYKKSADSTWSNQAHNGPGTSTTITSLTNGTEYQVQVQAKNSNGSSSWSASGAGTPAAVPAVPTAPTVSVPTSNNTGTSLDVSWTAPADNGSDLTDYDVQYRACTATPKSCTSSPTWGSWTSKAHAGVGTSTTITGLTKGTAYQIQVRATNSIGSSAYSPSTTGTPATKPATPSAPTITYPTPTNDGTSLDVSWDAPDDNGEAITDYDVRYCLNSTGCNADNQWTALDDSGSNASDTSTTASITGLTKGSAYQVQVRTTNDVGDSTWSPSGTGTPATVPPAPTGVTAAGGVAVGSGRLNVSWTAPTNNSGMPITGYEVEYRACTLTPPSCSGEETQSWGSWKSWTHTGTGTTAAITGLTNGTEYEVRVRSVNAVGHSASWSATDTDTPTYYPDTPGAPTVVGGKYGNTEIGDGKLKVSWSAPADNGSAITGYDVQYRVCTRLSGAFYRCGGQNATWGVWKSWTHTSAGTTATISGLENGKAYQVQVRATNGHGTSGWSGSGKDYPRRTPSKPNRISMNEVSDDGTSLVVGYCLSGDGYCEWENPGDTPVTYHFYWMQCADTDTTPGQCTTAWPNKPNHSTTRNPGKVLNLEVTGLTPKKKYWVRAQGCNAVGCGAYSDPTEATPFAKPKKPTSVTARWRENNNAADLSIGWTNPTDNGGRPINGYTIGYCPSSSDCFKWANWTFVQGSSNVTTVNLFSARACNAITHYRIRVLVTNAGGEGAWSDTVTSTGDCTSNVN